MFEPSPNIQKPELICVDAIALQIILENIVEKIKKEHVIQHDPFLTTEEAAHLLRCNDETLRKYWKEGSIARAKFSDKHVIYERESILAFIKKHNNTPGDGK